jgi:hypothetical protein
MAFTKEQRKEILNHPEEYPFLSEIERKRNERRFRNENVNEE